jgi:hypothetical protein
VLAFVAAGSAFAHAHLSPPVALAKMGQWFTLAVPTEKEDAITTKVVLTVPDGFSIGSVVEWSGPESSDTSAPTVEAVDSFGGGGSSNTLAIIAIVVGAVGIVLGGVALARGSGRDLT